MIAATTEFEAYQPKEVDATVASRRASLARANRQARDASTTRGSGK
jgi:hypothetical protein